MSNNLQEINLDKRISVTFVVIAFNEINGIVGCISSILNQNIAASKASIEVLVVDDGSTDGTADLVEKSFSSRVKVIRQENAGRGLARWKGVENAKTQLIAFVDSDIRLPENWLTICLENLNSYAGVAGIAVPDGDVATIQRIFHLSPKTKKGSISISGNNSLFRADVLRDSGRDWQRPLGEDFRLNHILLRQGFKLKTIDSLVVQHIESKTYKETLSFLYSSGVSAHQLWSEFRITRIPDIATVFFILTIICVPFLVPMLGLWCSVLPLALVLVVGFSNLQSKFYFCKNILRFMFAWLPNSFLILSYFLGRTSGIISFFRIKIGKKQK
jgi:glycosyltransferase involved in cell wall biosynthesis